MDSFSSLAFGEAVGALASDKPLPFATAFDYVQSRMMLRFFEMFWKITEWFSADGRRMRAEVKVIDDFVYRIIDARLSRKDQDAKNEDTERPREDLLDMYMRLRLEDGTLLTRVGLRCVR